MRMRDYKRKKMTCRVMSRMAAFIMWTGILLVLGTAGRIGLGMSLIYGGKLLLAEAALMAAAWIMHCISRYIERHIITFTDGTMKTK